MTNFTAINDAIAVEVNADHKRIGLLFVDSGHRVPLTDAEAQRLAQVLNAEALKTALQWKWEEYGQRYELYNHDRLVGFVALGHVFQSPRYSAFVIPTKQLGVYLDLGRAMAAVERNSQ